MAFGPADMDRSAAVHITIALATRAEILPISSMENYNKDSSD